MTVPYFHVDAEQAFKNGTAAPAGHPDVHGFFAGLLPAHHNNVTEIISNPAAHPLPWWHPAIDPWIGVNLNYSFNATT